MGQFVKIGTTEDLETLEAGKLVEAGAQRIALVNIGGKYYAIEDRYSHRGGPLSEGMLPSALNPRWPRSRSSML
jgi:nitrite reductase/ring-hydroxylating ferredoxin subunit